MFINADDEAEVEGIIKADPFYAAGVFQTWKIRPWKIVMANRELLAVG
ncbi:MAG: YciI family protein [Acidobacteriota bacterium]